MKGLAIINLYAKQNDTSISNSTGYIDFIMFYFKVGQR